MDRRRLLSGYCCCEALKYGRIQKRREAKDRDVEVQLSYEGKLSGDVLDTDSWRSITSGCQHFPRSSSAYLIWPPSSRSNGSADERATYFSGLQKASDLDRDNRLARGQQATTLLDLMTIRAFHTKALRSFSLGTALGFRTRGGALTNIPAIIVFVGRKMHKDWLLDVQRLPTTLEGPGGVWCDVDVVEFSNYGAATATSKEQLYTELVEGLRGNDPCIGAGSQVASQETYGTLGGVVRSRTAGHHIGFLTNRHVAVDLDYPNHKLFHPLPPNLGPGVYLGAVERATSFITDDLWYGVFAGMNPETFVRADGAFIPFTDTFDLTKLTTNLKGVGEMGEVMRADLQAPIDSLIGKHVLKVGRSSGLTNGVVMAYAVEYNDERSICYFTDFLIVGENGQPFDLEGDSGSLILLAAENEHEKPRPFGIIWGGTANRGRLKLRSGNGPESWTSGVDLGRLLDLLELDLITTPSGLLAAIEDQRSYQLGLERAEQGVPLDCCRDSTLDSGEESCPKPMSWTRRSEDVEEAHNLLPCAGSAVGGAGPSDLERVTSNQIERTESSFPPLDHCLESSLLQGGALQGDLLSSSKQEGKGRMEDEKLGLGDHDEKRRRLS